MLFRRSAALLVLCISFSRLSFAGIHRAPIVIKAKEIGKAARYPVGFYRLFRSDAQGNAIPIPFQIDEVNRYGDYVLDKGPEPNNLTGNGYFDQDDELSFMGDDVGHINRPTRWPENRKPHLIFSINLSKATNGVNRKGAVFLAVYYSQPSALDKKKYVIFDTARDRIVTSRYDYRFDQKNYLVVRDVSLVTHKAPPQQVISSSTFYLLADLKYFWAIDANHRSVDSQLESYKTGPVRTIVRVKFLYKFLSLNFEAGMYTEVSFFSNAVVLPTVLHNPIDGQKLLSEGSNFYYGFNLTQGLGAFKVNTNIDSAQNSKPKITKTEQSSGKEAFWLSLEGESNMFFMEIEPSESMTSKGNTPKLYTEVVSPQSLSKRDNSDPLPLGEAPVNIALSFNLQKFSEGDHKISFKLFFENDNNRDLLQDFRTLEDWKKTVERI